MKKVKDALGARMKENYENRAKTSLLRRTPVAIRIDGKAFHTFTRGFEKPFDRNLMTAMQETMKALCEQIPGCVLGYTQSDEITLILTDYKKLNSAAWFDYEVQKISSIAASIATLAFNRSFDKLANETIDYMNEAWNTSDAEEDYEKALLKALSSGAMFDARCFNIPKEEVCNLVYWRQQDASKNSVQMAARAYFTHSQLQNKSSSQMQEMLFSEKGINWNNYPTDCKRGSCCIKTDEGWIIDREIPIFKGEGRSYVEDRINFESDLEKGLVLSEEEEPAMEDMEEER